MTEERRLVTILFADVVGSTALGESLDPEDVRALLGRLFAIAREAVERHGGRVEKFIGDAVMAVFGLPVAHEDDAVRGCLAALELRDRVREDAVLTGRIAIRLGLNTGDVIATRDQDAGEFLVTGDPVNTAARLQQGAESSSILVGERTVQAVGSQFIFGDPVGIEAKGKATPLPARPLITLAGEAHRAPRHRIVGRETDLAELRLAGNRALRERRPTLVSIVAPAGVGKSRLLEEFLDELDPSVTVATAQCLPYGQRLTYWPMRGILLSILELPADASPDEVRGALHRWLSGVGEVDANRIEEQLAATVGAAEADSSDRFALFAAWRRFVELVADRAPLVLVIEDLHWSSDSLLDLVESILQPRGDVPLLMIVLARPELLDRRPGWGGGRRNAVSLALDPLPEREVAELVADLLTNPAPAIIAAVVARAEGNPFYAGEIVRSLADRLGSDQDPTAIARAVAALPDTVQATVLARLDGLEAHARRVVQLGSVVGRSFDAPMIPALDPALGPGEVEAAIENLAEHDLVRVSGRWTATFRHILFREVAYNTLPRRERARLHAAAGAWLESEATTGGREDELAELIAFHLREATSLGTLVGETASPELSENAVRWLRRAAEAANAGAATVEAARHLEAAIGLARAELLPDLYERLGQIWVGGDQAVEAFKRANALGRELGLGTDQDLRTLAQAAIVIGRWGASLAAADPADVVIDRFARLRDLVTREVSERALLFGTLALAMGTGTSRGAAIVPADTEAGETALAIARRLDDPDLISAALDALTVADLDDDRIESMLSRIAARRAISDRLSVSERLDVFNMTAWTFALKGDLEVAQQAGAEARTGLVAGQASSYVLGASAWRTFALHALGRWDEALAEATRGERSWVESETRTPLFAIHGFVAASMIGRARLDPETAARWRDVATTILDRSDPSGRAQSFRAILDDDLPRAELELIQGSRRFAGRLDYVHLGAWLLADRQFPADVKAVADLAAYTHERGVGLVEAAARRLLGLVRQDAAELAAALASYERSSAAPLAARVRVELGILTHDRELVRRGLAELESHGDLEHWGRATTMARQAGLVDD